MKISNRYIALSYALVFISLNSLYSLNADGKSEIVPPESHNQQNDLDVKQIDDKINEITYRIKNEKLSSHEKKSLKKERKELKKQKSKIFMKEIGLDPDVKGPVTYGN
jgi:vacuolar-type H+-ATPase subunit I/STV1